MAYVSYYLALVGPPFRGVGARIVFGELLFCHFLIRLYFIDDLYPLSPYSPFLVGFQIRKDARANLGCHKKSCRDGNDQEGDDNYKMLCVVTFFRGAHNHRSIE